MKRLLSGLLILLLLTGCAASSPEETTQADTQATEPPVLHLAHTSDPYEHVSREDFYASYTPACCYQDAQYRSKHGFLSGSLEVPGQYLTRAQEQPMEAGMYIRNTDCFYADDGNTYIVTDAWGNEVLRLYRGGGYITLEEVAAYMYAFGGSEENLPANYTSKKSGRPGSNMWGEYLRLNHSYFKNDPRKYPYEPKLPSIAGSIGGTLRYYEMDIGTTGTETPGYKPRPYNDGSSITRGAGRLVYTRQDANGNGILEPEEVHVFYTHNHYNDFTEYLNYFGGWGQTFGNITGGGVYDSKTQCSPTQYPETLYESFSQWEEAA